MPGRKRAKSPTTATTAAAAPEPIATLTAATAITVATTTIESITTTTAAPVTAPVIPSDQSSEAEDKHESRGTKRRASSSPSKEAEGEASGAEGGENEPPTFGRTKSMHHSKRLEGDTNYAEEDDEFAFMPEEFVAVHTTEARFWLAKLEEAIAEGTSPETKVAVTWLDAVEGTEEYTLGLEDKIEVGSLMMAVEMVKRNSKYSIEPESMTDLEQQLKRQERFDGGGAKGGRKKKQKASEAGEGEEEDTKMEEGGEVEEVDDEEDDDEAKPRKKRAVSPKMGAKKPRGRKPSAKKASVKKVSVKKVSVKKPKKPKKPAKRKGKLTLLPQPEFPLLPDLFTRKGPFCSFDGDMQRANKEVIRAYLSGERELFEKLVNSVEYEEKIQSVHSLRAVHVRKNALFYAIVANDEAAIRLLLADTPRKGYLQGVSLEVQGSGRAFRFARRHKAVQASRGGKEGNNAFAKELEGSYYPSSNRYAQTEIIIEALCYPSVTVATLQLVMALFSSLLDEHVMTLVRWGRLALAGVVVGILQKNEGHGFNKLHEQVLTLRTEPLEKFLKVSVGKKPLANKNIRPTHCAAINPNSAYLKALLDCDPSMLRITDDDRGSLVHYAAACEGTGPLKLVLAHGLSYNETDSSGQTPLMWAARCNRPDNIQLLIKAGCTALGTPKNVDDAMAEPATAEQAPAPEQKERGAEEKKEERGAEEKKEERGGVEEEEEEKKESGPVIPPPVPPVAAEPLSEAERKRLVLKEQDTAGLVALHHACIHGNVESVRALAEAGADLEQRATATPHNNFTAFLFACQHGHFELLKVLESLGASMAGVDKLGKTGLMIAAQEGHLDIACFLLKAGVDPNAQDTSGNTAAHYAAAYGWHEILEILAKGGAVLDALNTWKTSPLVVAIKLGRFVCVNWLLDQNIDVNAKDTKGRTLLVDVCDSLPAIKTLAVIHKLLEHKELDVNIQDTQGDTAMHALARSSSDLALEAARLLLERKPDVSLMNAMDQSPLTTAIERQKLELCKLLLTAGSRLKGENKQGKNVLHSLAELALRFNLQPLLEIMKSTLDSEFAGLAKVVDNNGFTPLLSLALALSRFSHNPLNCPVTAENVSAFLATFPKEVLTATVGPQKQLQPTDPIKWVSEGGYSVAHFAAICHDSWASAILRGWLFCQPELLCDTFLNIQDQKGFTAVHLAVKSGLAGDFVEALVKAGASVNSHCKDAFNNTPLHCAASSGKTLLASTLLRCGADVNARDGLLRTPLHAAVIYEHLEIAQVLLENKAQVNDVDEDGRTALHFAVNNCTGDANATFVTEQLLISHGASVNARDRFGRLPLHYGFIQIAYLDAQLPKKSRRLDPGFTGKIRSANPHDPIETVTSLCAIKELKLDVADDNKSSPIHFASRVGAAACFSYLTRRIAKEELEKMDRDGNSPLGLALLHNQPNFAIMVIQKGPDVNKPVHSVTREDGEEKSRKTHSMFFEAIKNGWQGVAYLLLDAGYSYLNAIQDALVGEKFQLVLTLLSKIQPEHIKSDSEGNSLMHYLAKTRNHYVFDQSFSVQIGKVLITKGVNPLQIAADGRSALHWAAFNGHAALIGYLLELKVSAREIDASGQTPLSLLVQGSSGTVRYLLSTLLDAKADIDHQFPETTKIGGKKHKHPATSITTVLNRAVRAQDAELVQLLLSRNASLTIQDGAGFTPLAHAVVLNNIGLATTLLAHAKGQTTSFNTVLKDVVSCVDKKKRSLVHLCVNPLSYGSYESTAMLQLLASHGTPLNLPDSAGHVPLYHAMLQASGVMKTCLLKLGAIECPPPHARRPSGVFDWPTPDVDFESDAKVMQERLKAAGSEEKKEIIPKPNRFTDATQLVVRDEDSKLFYDCTLTKVNLKHGAFGENEFYKMQVLTNQTTGLFVLFTNWGRIGDYGKYQQTPFGTLEEAIAEFHKIFKSKTGNVWGQPFTKVDKKYLLREREEKEYVTAETVKSLDSRRKEEKEREKGLLADRAKSTLSPEVQDTIHMLTNVALLRAGSSTGGVDLPLGRMNKETLEKASQTLQLIKASLAKTKELRAASPTLDLAAILAEAERLAELSSTYYELIPHTEFHNEPIRPFTEQTLQQESSTLSSLMNLEIAAKVVLASQVNPAVIHPFDYCFKALDVNLEIMSPSDPEYGAIVKYSRLENAGNMEIEHIYRLQRQGEAKQMTQWQEISNHALLWHGTKSFNVVGIMRQGLRVAPPEAPATGYMFGKGIYFADMLQKSISYCGGIHASERGFAFLCEVALGNMNELLRAEYMEKPREGTHSTKGIGLQFPSPDQTVTLTNGIHLPLGQPQTVVVTDPLQRPSLSYNEFIVYDASQVRMRYLVQLRERGAIYNPDKELITPSAQAEDDDDEEEEEEDDD